MEAARSRPSGAGRSTPSGWAAIALLIGLVIGGFGMYFATKSAPDPLAGRVDTSRYQTVVLSNDKVYFGRVSTAGDEFFQLKDVYFLRETAGATASDAPTRSLLHLNQELQAPDNDMLVHRSQVVLIENLAKDSPIQKEIVRQRGGK